MATCLGASLLKPGHLGKRANPPQYAPFGKILDTKSQSAHALNRLTFGPRPGDLANLQRLSLPKWLDAQLYPERIPENPALAPKLAPLTSLNLSSRATALQYPSPQLIAAVVHGKAPLPDDPQLRRIVQELAARYVAKKGITPADNLEDDLEPKMALTDLITLQQVQVIDGGTPEQKKALLAAIPAAKYSDLVWALRPKQRKDLLNLAPVTLRRDLELSYSPPRVVAEDLIDAKLLRAVYSNRQLQELLVDFWFNHFNVFIDKGADRYLVTSYERDSIRPHVLGKFYDLLLATAQSPAMLFYLDNWQSVGEAQSKGKHGLNENYGRELLELHTLGVDGGYTQQDVVNVARCFTGWTIAKPNQGGGFEYNDKVHDHGEKLVLGHKIAAGGGMEDGLEVLRLLSKQPATAHFICLKLARRFVADDPPPSLMKRMQETFLKSDGDLREVMRCMLHAPEFWSEGSYRAKVKTPFEMVASVLRATNADVASAITPANEIQKLGEPLYRKIEPTGYSSANAEWVASASLLERMNFSLVLARGKVAGVTVDSAAWQNATLQPDKFARDMLNQPDRGIASVGLQKTLAQQVLEKAPATTLVGLILGSPDFQRH